MAVRLSMRGRITTNNPLRLQQNFENVSKDLRRSPVIPSKILRRVAEVDVVERSDSRLSAIVTDPSTTFLAYARNSARGDEEGEVLALPAASARGDGREDNRNTRRDDENLLLSFIE